MDKLKNIIEVISKPDLQSPIKYRCKACKDTGYIVVNAFNDAIAIELAKGKQMAGALDVARVQVKDKGFTATPCKKCKKIYLDQLLSRSIEYTEAFVLKDYTLEKYETTNEEQAWIKNQVSEYSKHFKESWLILSSRTNGTGKTHLIKALINHWYKTLNTDIIKSPPVFLEMPTVFRKILNDKDKSWFNLLMEIIKDASVVFLDDVGVEKFKPDGEGSIWTHNIYFEIINARSALNKPIAITTNFLDKSVNDLNIKMGRAAVSRLVGKVRKEYCLVFRKTVDYRIDNFMKGVK
jgi:DNA replication protein DnaC